MEKYLYGAAVQGIQNFIFRTDKLREIVGASELVESICTVFFKSKVRNFRDEYLLTGAAGNIKYLFDKKEDCENFVLLFPKEVMAFAPGITISQAVVKIEGSLSIGHINELESLLRIQRNKPVALSDFGLHITERCRRTGLAALEYVKNEALDPGTVAKLKILNDEHKQFAPIDKIVLDNSTRLPYDFEELSQNGSHSWMAVVHIDGNGLGKVLMQLGHKLVGKNEDEIIRIFKRFSTKLEISTVEAANEAVKRTIFKEKGRGKRDILPFRPIVLGGDDLTVIVRAGDALVFVREFLRLFEERTNVNMNSLFKEYSVGLERLTACAGIAFIKSSYPFHYGYRLAEELCGEAKKVAKAKRSHDVSSCLMFFKVQSSYISKYGDLVSQELTCYDNLSFSYGPYYLNEEEGPSIDWLLVKAQGLQRVRLPRRRSEDGLLKDMRVPIGLKHLWIEQYRCLI